MSAKPYLDADGRVDRAKVESDVEAFAALALDNIEPDAPDADYYEALGILKGIEFLKEQESARSSESGRKGGSAAAAERRANVRLAETLARAAIKQNPTLARPRQGSALARAVHRRWPCGPDEKKPSVETVRKYLRGFSA